MDQTSNTNTTISCLSPRMQHGIPDSFGLSLVPRVSAATILASFFVPLATAVIFRLYIHPLRKIPGPRLAALSKAYAFFFNYIREGGYCKQFKGLHEGYKSSVIRIGPNDVHVDDVGLFEQVFRVGTKYHKDPGFYRGVGGLDGMLDLSHFRTYKSHLASLYSARHADMLQPRLVEELDNMSKRLSRGIKTGQEVNIQKMFRTLSADMVLHILFPNDINLFETEEYHPFLQSVDMMLTKTWLIFTYPSVANFVSRLPISDYPKLRAAIKTFTKYCEAWMKDAQALHNSGSEQARDSHVKRYLELDPTDVKKTVIPYPLQDIFNFIAGGTDTTAYTTSCAVYHLLKWPKVLQKLQEELDEAAPFIRQSFDYKKIQSLPYLNAVIKETLRISSPAPGCLPRIVPEGGVQVDSIFIPPGTALSISHWSVQRNAALFPEPERFMPERWLGEEGKTLAKWNIAFSRGPRQCIGTNIAYLELHGCIAYLFSRFEMALSGDYGDELEWVDRFTSTIVQQIKVNVIKDRWAQMS